MKTKKQARNHWFRGLERWFELVKGDIEQVVFCQAPGASAWSAMTYLVDHFDYLIESEEAELAPASPNAILKLSLQHLREYVSDVEQGPLLETRLGKWVFLTATRLCFGMPQQPQSQRGLK